MTTRTFKQKGQAYGSTTASIVASINGVTVYSGTVNTVNEPMPSLPDTENSYGVDLFSWQEDAAFAGTQTISIAVTGSDLLLTDSIANYVAVLNPDYNPSDPASKEWISGGADVYGSFYNITEDGTNYYSDPFTNEAIDGNSQEHVPDPDLPGQWYWRIPAGSTFTATVNIQAGTV